MAKAETLEYPLAGPLAEAALKEMAGTARLQRQGSERATYVVLDTFDWRLFGAGLRAVLEPGHLTVYRLADGGIEGRCGPVTPPVPATAIDDAHLRALLAPILSIRALVPAACLRRSRTTYAVLNEDAKTVARIRLDDRRCLGPDGTPTAPRERVLVLEPVRGYPGAHKALRRALDPTLGARRPAPDPLGRALDAAPRRPGETASGLDMVLDPGARTDASMKVILGRLLAAMEENQAGMLARHDTEFLHDYRVAVRRTRSALTQVKGVFAASIADRFRADFARLGTLTGPARDMDVYLLALDDYRALLEPPLRDHLDALGALLEERRDTAYADLARELGRARYRRIMVAWSGFLARPVPRRPTAVNAARPVKAVADERIRRMYRRVLREGGAIRRDSPPEELHELRKSGKKLRYLMEFFASLYPPRDIGRLIKTLKRFQDNLGLYQDLSVQIAHLAGFEEELTKKGRLDEGGREAMNQLLARLAVQREAAHDEFDERFATFSATSVQEHFSGLFTGDA